MGPRCSGLSAPGKACIRWGARTKARQCYYDENVLEIHRCKENAKGHIYPSKPFKTEPETATEG